MNKIHGYSLNLKGLNREHLQDIFQDLDKQYDHVGESLIIL